MEGDELTNALEPLLIQLTALVEKLIELAGGLMDNPIGLIILLFLLPTIFGFFSNILGFVLDIVGGIIHIMYQIIIAPFTLGKFCLNIYKHRSKKPKRKWDEEFGQKYGYADEGEYQKIEFGEPPTTHKKAKQTTPDQDLAASLKTNLLDE